MFLACRGVSGCHLLPMSRRDGTLALVTGSARGIGLAVTRAFVAEGARVLLPDIRADALRRAGEALGRAGLLSAGVVADVLVASGFGEFDLSVALFETGGSFGGQFGVAARAGDADAVSGVGLL